MSDTVKYLLPESEMLKSWYNTVADLLEPLPPILSPGTVETVGLDDLAPLFPMELILQEVSAEFEKSYIDKNPDSRGSPGIAISEAVEVAATTDDVKYALRNILNHVSLHQTLIGQKAIK